MTKREKLKKLLEAWKSDLQRMKILDSPAFYIFSSRTGKRETFLLPPVWEGNDLSFRITRDVHRACIKVNACEVIGMMTKTIPNNKNQHLKTKVICIASDSIDHGYLSVTLPYKANACDHITFGEEIWETYCRDAGSFFGSALNAIDC